jgi:hypothetical protein
MAIDRLYTLRELSDVSGYSEYTLREMASNNELPAVRRGKRGWIRIRESAWAAWQEQHTTCVKPIVVVQLNPPKSAPVNKPAAVDVGEFIPSGFKSPFARSA